MSARSILAGILLIFVAIPARTLRPAQSNSDLPLLVYTVAHSYDPLAWIHGKDRFSLDATIFLRDQKGSHKLVPSFAETADASVSFDGGRIVFAGKARVSDHWQIWEISLDSDTPRRITAGADDCIRPFYLPGERMVYARRSGGRFVIEALDLAGGKPLPLTYSWGNVLPTDVLRDGRILFEASFPLGADSSPELYTVYSDGSGVESYRCDHGPARYSGKQTSSGDIVFAATHGLARFTSARAQEIRMAAPGGEYSGDVAEMPSGEWLVSWRPNGKAPFELVRWAPGSANLRPLVAEPGQDVVEPVLIAPRSVPKRHPSGLHDWPNANLLCLNAYTSKYVFASGSIRSVRMYALDAAGHATILGTAPVERDGSFFLQVPTEQPIRLEVLDASGKTLRRESGAFWMRRGEQRVCVGCHAGPETSPENAVPMILLKSTTPADLTHPAVANAAGGH